MRVIVAIFSICISLLALYFLRDLSNKETDLDHLQKPASQIVSKIPDARNIYYLSNNGSEELYYKSQFSLAPKVVAKTDFVNIPKNMLVLYIVDNRVRGTNDQLSVVSAKSDSLMSYSNKYFKFLLFKKK